MFVDSSRAPVSSWINTHQRHFAAAVPALPTVPASEGERACHLDRIEVITITIPSYAASPIIHIHLHSATTPKPAVPAPHNAPSFNIEGKERVLHDIVDEVLAQGVRILLARRLRRCRGVIKAACHEGSHETEMSAPTGLPVVLELSHLTFA
ncbi:hypothetical protein EI94DRAFT_1804071 [Lactarius quietus]|nr:hypothetical protein EI94DRAFT_1804071 [Lactarius quietus]